MLLGETGGPVSSSQNGNILKTLSGFLFLYRPSFPGKRLGELKKNKSLPLNKVLFISRRIVIIWACHWQGGSGVV